MKTTPKVCTQKSFFFNISTNNYIFLEEIFYKEIKFFKIPKGTTGKIPPVNGFGFRIWKNFVRHFSDSVILMNSDVNSLQSLVHNQLSSSRYINIFKQGWFKSNYIDKKPEKFDNPVEFGFGSSQSHCEIPGCENVAIIR